MDHHKILCNRLITKQLEFLEAGESEYPGLLRFLNRRIDFDPHRTAMRTPGNSTWSVSAAQLKPVDATHGRIS